jgi:hypothetical protein
MAEARIGADVKGALIFSIVLTLLAVLVGDATLSHLIGIVVFGSIVFMMVRVPLRHSMMALMFLALTLENPSENFAAGHWQSPLFIVGAVYFLHLSVMSSIPVPLSGLEVLLGVLAVIALLRKSSGSKIDSAGRIATPQPLVKLAWLSFAGIAFVLLVGMARGGNFSMALWQVDRVVHLPVVFLLLHLALRGPKDHEALARVLISAAVVRACVAVYVVNTVVVPDYDGRPGQLAWATSHHDSILFACAFVVLISMMLERVGRRATRTALLLLPVLALGMVANNRRMVWVQIAMVFATLYFATPTNATKRKIKIAVLLLSPLILGYLAAGWDSKDGIFKPVAMVRSVVDPQSDASTLWRELENYDILFTMRHYWLLGAGYGNPYWEVVPLPEIPYELEKYLPHNSILGLWCFCGFLGYTALTLLWGAGVYFAMRAYRASQKPTDRVAALTSLGSVLVYMIQCYGDMGLGSWTGVFIVGAAVCVAGKLAVAVGAWPSSSKQPKKSVPAPVARPVEGQVA